jgi:glycosyltransferase involved in cell wall biosynthesis
MKPLLYTVCPRPPHSTRDGAAIRNFYLLRALAREFRVRTFALVPPHLRKLPQEWPEGVEAETIAQSSRPLRRAGALAASLASNRPYAPLLYRSRALPARLRAAVEREKPAWILAHSFHVAPLVPAGAGPLWVDFHNMDSEIWRRMGQSASRSLVRAFARAQAPRLSRLEADLVRRAAGISCVSEREAALFSRLAVGVSPLVVPNGVDLERYRFRSRPADSEVVFYVGDLTWPPNADGIRWFQAEVWPRIARRRPAARAEVLGRGAPPGAERQRLRYLGEGGDTRPARRSPSYLSGSREGLG